MCSILLESRVDDLNKSQNVFFKKIIGIFFITTRKYVFVKGLKICKYFVHDWYHSKAPMSWKLQPRFRYSLENVFMSEHQLQKNNFFWYFYEQKYLHFGEC